MKLELFNGAFIVFNDEFFELYSRKNSDCNLKLLTEALFTVHKLLRFFQIRLRSNLV